MAQLRHVKEKHKDFHYEVPFVFNGFFEEEELYAQVFGLIKKLAEGKEFTTYKIAVSWPKDLKDEAVRFHLKYAFQNKMNNEFGEKFKKAADFYYPDCHFLIDFPNEVIKQKLKPVFFTGRYCKFSRSIAQTEYFCNKCYGRGCWYCKGTGHFSNESVEELIGAYFKKYCRAKDIIMHGAGREDMDVLMLGSGRPFSMEVISPEVRTINLDALEKEINEGLVGKVFVNSLKNSNRDEVAPLKDAPHEKIYCAIVCTTAPIDAHILGRLVVGTPISIIQKTPTRVAKRRANLEREKSATFLEVQPIDATHFSLTLKTSHGTYVKEFISGDGEKTKPSIASILGVGCLCEQLDVLEILDSQNDVK